MKAVIFFIGKHKQYKENQNHRKICQKLQNDIFFKCFITQGIILYGHQLLLPHFAAFQTACS